MRTLAKCNRLTLRVRQEPGANVVDGPQRVPSDKPCSITGKRGSWHRASLGRADSCTTQNYRMAAFHEGCKEPFARQELRVDQRFWKLAFGPVLEGIIPRRTSANILSGYLRIFRINRLLFTDPIHRRRQASGPA